MAACASSGALLGPTVRYTATSIPTTSSITEPFLFLGGKCLLVSQNILINKSISNFQLMFLFVKIYTNTYLHKSCQGLKLHPSNWDFRQYFSTARWPCDWIPQAWRCCSSENRRVLRDFIDVQKKKLVKSTTPVAGMDFASRINNRFSQILWQQTRYSISHFGTREFDQGSRNPLLIKRKIGDQGGQRTPPIALVKLFGKFFPLNLSRILAPWSHGAKDRHRLEPYDFAWLWQ